LLGVWVLVCLLLLSPILPRGAFAQGDPHVADVNIDLEVALLFRIGGIEDVTFGSYSGHGNLTRTDDVCVWTNASSGSYRVTAEGDGGGANKLFTVAKSNNAATVIEYTVSWTTAGGTTPLSPKVASANQSGANTVSSTCASGPANPASYTVTFDEADLLRVPHGSYSGILTLIISGPTS